MPEYVVLKIILAYNHFENSKFKFIQVYLFKLILELVFIIIFGREKKKIKILKFEMGVNDVFLCKALRK